MYSFKLRHFWFILIFSAFTAYAETPEETASTAFAKYCPAVMQENKKAIFFNIIGKIPRSTQAEAYKALELVLPQSCMADFPAWLIDRTFNLAIYGIHEHKLKETTIGYLTELVPVSSIGKMEYIEYGIIIEHLTDAGVPKELVFDFLHYALDSGFTEIGTEALSYFYTQALLEKKSHKEAIEIAVNSSQKLKRFSDPVIMKTNLFENPSDNKGKPSQETIDNSEKKWQAFWKSNHNRIHYSESYKKMPLSGSENENMNKLRNMAGAPYGYRSNKANSIDIIGLISILTNEKIENLPYEMDTFCTFGSVTQTPSHLQPGDLLFFGSHPGSRDTILNGISLDNDEFILITQSRGLQIFSLADEFYKKRIIKSCRILK